VADASATSSVLAESLARLSALELGPEDQLVLMFETHYVGAGTTGRFVGADDAAGGLPAPRLVAALGEAAERGCRVLLLADAVHEGTEADWGRGFRELARELTRKGVITFVASNQGPSRRVPTEAHGAFALGLLQATTARGQALPWADPASALTLDDFRASVIRRVEELTRRKQHAACYVPETMSSQTPLFGAEPGP
jgi:hypothetical protein